MILQRSLFFGLSLTALATSAVAQSAPSTEEIVALRAQVQALSARLEHLEAQARVSAPAASSATLPAAFATVSAAGPVTPAAGPAAQAPAAASSVDWASGLPEWRSPDGSFSFKPRIRVTADLSTTFDSDFDNRNLTTTELRGLRLGGQGRTAGGFTYWIEADLADNAVSIANAFVSYTRKVGGRDLEVSAGQRLNDRGVEGGTPEDQVPFLERSLMVSTIGPERGGYGVGLTSKLTGSVWHASLSLTGDAISTGTTNDSVTLMGRAHWSPFKTEAGFMHVGGWGFVEDLTPNASVASRSLLLSSRGNDNLRLSGAAYADPKGSKGLGLELGGLHRSGWLMAEGGRRVFETAARDFDQDAFSVSAGLFLTGELPPLSTRTGTWGRPKVLNPLGPDGYGAIEVVGRYDSADYTDSPTGGEADTWLLGLNWYPTNNTRVSGHWSFWSVENRSGAFIGDDSGNTATLRVQTAF